MQDLFALADEFGPAKIIHAYEPSLGLRGILVVDNVAAGPSIGGVRMAPDVSLEECARLARAMTLKNAAAGLAHGGGKSVIYGDPRMPLDDKERLVRAFACALADIHDYIFGPDMATDEQCMAWVKDEIGRACGLPRELGGIPLDEIGATGWGLRHAVEIAAGDAEFELDGARLVVQGYGAVGRHAAHFLSELGARLVACSDSRGAVHDPDGLDLTRLDEIKAAGGSVAAYAEATKIPPEALLEIECEVWIPAARPDVINGDNVKRLRTRMVAQGANIPCTIDAERYLHEQGVLALPDFIANAGGVICAAMEYHGSTQTQVFETIAEKIRANTAEVLSRVRKAAITPRAAALELAQTRVRAAMSTRRWTVY